MKINKKTSMNGEQQQKYSLVRLSTSDLESVYDLELRAKAELPDFYILKSREFMLSCLESGFSVGAVSEGNLVGVLPVSVTDGKTGMYAEILGENLQAGERVAFREGAYLVPVFRGKNIARDLGNLAWQLIKEEGIKEVYAAVSPDHYRQLNRLTRSYGAVIKKFYNAVFSGKIRYLLQYTDPQTYSSTDAKAVPIADHSRQKELFGEGFVGTSLEFKDKEVFIHFQKPE